MTAIVRQNLRGAAAMALCLPLLLPLVGAVLAPTAGCAALDAAAPGLEQAAAKGLVAFVAAEAQAQGVPPTSPAYQAAVMAAQALEAEQADASAQVQAKLDAIVTEMHRRHRHAHDGGAQLPSAPAVLPSVDAGKDGAL